MTRFPTITLTVCDEHGYLIAESITPFTDPIATSAYESFHQLSEAAFALKNGKTHPLLEKPAENNTETTTIEPEPENTAMNITDFTTDELLAELDERMDVSRANTLAAGEATLGETGSCTFPDCTCYDDDDDDDLVSITLVAADGLAVTYFDITEDEADSVETQIANGEPVEFYDANDIRTTFIAGFFVGVEIDPSNEGAGNVDAE